MLDKAKQTIKKFKMLKKGEKVLVAVSGGVDSIALLQALFELKDEFELSLAVAHLDHQMRPDSYKDARFVKERAKALGLSGVLKSLNVPAFIKKHELSPEEGAREARYNFLRQTAKKLKANKVALGHHLNDQAETFLMRLLRGAGLEGLRGIPPVRDEFIRPLIECSRKEILQFAQERKLQFCEDRTNLETKYLRNRIRLELLPLLEQYNPNVLQIVAHTEEILRQASLYLEAQACEKLREATLSLRRNSMSLDREKLLRQPEILRELMIRQAIEHVKGDLRAIEFVHVKEILREIEADKNRSQLQLPDGLLFGRRAETIIFSKRQEPRTKSQPCKFPLSLAEATLLKKIGWRFGFERLSSPRKKHTMHKRASAPIHFEECVDYDNIKPPLCVRNRRPGDRFVPLGMKESKKLQDFFVDLKVPYRKRDAIPLLCDQNGIIWVVGMRLSDIYKVTPRTKRILKIIAKRTPRLTKEDTWS